jgi:hypothetical protein
MGDQGKEEGEEEEELRGPDSYPIHHEADAALQPAAASRSQHPTPPEAAAAGGGRGPGKGSSSSSSSSSGGNHNDNSDKTCRRRPS